MDCQPRGFCFLKLVFVGTARRWLMGNKPKRPPRLWQRCAGALHRWPLKWANKACCEVWNHCGQPWKNCKIHQKLSNNLKRWNFVPKQVSNHEDSMQISSNIEINMTGYWRRYSAPCSCINETLCEMICGDQRKTSLRRVVSKVCFPRIVVVCLWNSLVMSSRCERLLINNGRLIGWLESGES